MKNETPKVTLVTLDNFYGCVDNPDAKYFFGELCQLRKEGYGPDYPENFLPIDASDYYCWHHLYCVNIEGRLVPISALRAVPMTRCDFYNHTIPLLRTAQLAESEDHCEFIENLMERNRQRGGECVYSAGFTVKKDWRKNRELAKVFRELTAAVTYHDSVYRNVQSFMGAAVLRFKVQDWYPNMGYQYFEKNGEELGPIIKKQANNERMMLISMDRPSDWAKECYLKYQKIFDNRIEISPVTAQVEKKTHLKLAA